MKDAFAQYQTADKATFEKDLSKAIEQARTVPGCSQTARKDLYAQVQNMVAEGAGWNFLFQERTSVAANQKIQGINPRRGPLPTGSTKPVFVDVAPVTITGRGLRNVTQVVFAGVRAVFNVDSDRRITAVAPVGVHTGPIILRTADGFIRNAGIYRVYVAG